MNLFVFLGVCDLFIIFEGKVGSDDVDGINMAYTVVADHIRSLSFAIADGLCPG